MLDYNLIFHLNASGSEWVTVGVVYNEVYLIRPYTNSTLDDLKFGIDNFILHFKSYDFFFIHLAKINFQESSKSQM